MGSSREVKKILKGRINLKMSHYLVRTKQSPFLSSELAALWGEQHEGSLSIFLCNTNERSFIAHFQLIKIGIRREGCVSGAVSNLI